MHEGRKEPPAAVNRSGSVIREAAYTGLAVHRQSPPPQRESPPPPPPPPPAFFRPAEANPLAERTGVTVLATVCSAAHSSASCIQCSVPILASSFFVVIVLACK